jgi:hypothetical protein
VAGTAAGAAAGAGFGFDTITTMKPFSSILYDSTVCASCKILPGDGC